jgi:hypothetical protein
MQIMSLAVSESPIQMYVMGAGTKLNTDLMQEIGTGVLSIRAQTDNGNATKK